MTPSPNASEADFNTARELMNRLLDNELSAHDLATLERLVCDHRDIRQHYILNMHLWCNLAPHFVASLGAEHETASRQAASPSDHAPGDVLKKPSLESGDAMVLPAMDEDSDADSEPITLPPLVWPLRAPEPKKLWQHRWIRAASAIAALVLLAVSIGLFWPRQRPVATKDVSPAVPTVLPQNDSTVATPDDAPAAPPRISAILATAVGAEWAEPHGSLARGQLLPRETLRLKAGLAEVRFDNGVAMIVEAPARIQIETDMRTKLLSGKVVATVPPAANGFAIATTSTQIVDLGTEFGVEVENDGATRVEVFQGKVQANAPSTTSAPFTNRQLLAGQAGRVATGATQVAEVPVAPLSFVREDEFVARDASLRGSTYGRWLAHTFQLRRDRSLAAYYMFDQAGGGEQLLNRSIGAPVKFDATLGHGGNAATRPEWAKGRWPEKRALDFSAAARQGAFLPEFPYSKNGRLTVSAWVYARSWAFWGAIAKSRGESKETTGQFSLGLYSGEGTLVGRITQGDGKEILAKEPAGAPVPVNQWVHVAMVADGTTLRLFRDGREVAVEICGAPIANPEPKSLSIGYRAAGFNDTPSRSNNGEHWDGTIDELAIFHRALSAEEVRSMYEAGKPGA